MRTPDTGQACAACSWALGPGPGHASALVRPPHEQTRLATVSSSPWSVTETLRVKPLSCLPGPRPRCVTCPGPVLSPVTCHVVSSLPWATRPRSPEDLRLARDLASVVTVRPDAWLLGHNASAPSFKKLLIHLFLFIYSYPLVTLLIVLNCSLTAYERMAAGPPRHSVRPPSRRTAQPLALPGTTRACLLVAKLSYRPCQGRRAAAFTWPRPPVARGADASLSRCVATVASPPSTSDIRPLPPVNITHRQASILSSGTEMLR